ncbi:MAG: hypothetical protein FWG68_07130 [Defluviitaleaceae bacterium]|nr:hypothetical protein [Defluviitaleaceae bacterium]
MATKMPEKHTMKEFKLLGDVAEDFGRFGKTDRKCSRCGNDFEHFTNNNSYQTKCKTPNCLAETCRGI